jgi:hypothetical protein
MNAHLTPAQRAQATRIALKIVARMAVRKYQTGSWWPPKSA